MGFHRRPGSERYGESCQLTIELGGLDPSDEQMLGALVEHLNRLKDVFASRHGGTLAIVHWPGLTS